MTISLPHLWLAGHLAALFGAVFAVLHLVQRPRAAVVFSALAGLATCGVLAYILHAIGHSFFGVYQWLAWVVAFFAGYAVGSILAWGGRLAARAYAQPSAGTSGSRT